MHHQRVGWEIRQQYAGFAKGPRCRGSSRTSATTILEHFATDPLRPLIPCPRHLCRYCRGTATRQNSEISARSRLRRERDILAVSEVNSEATKTADRDAAPAQAT